MVNKSFESTWGQADRLITKKSTRDKKKRNGEKAKKKDVGSSCLYLRVSPQVLASQTIDYVYK